MRARHLCHVRNAAAMRLSGSLGLGKPYHSGQCRRLMHLEPPLSDGHEITGSSQDHGTTDSISRSDRHEVMNESCAIDSAVVRAEQADAQ